MFYYEFLHILCACKTNTELLYNSSLKSGLSKREELQTPIIIAY